MSTDRALQPGSRTTSTGRTTPSVLREFCRDHVNQLVFVVVATAVGLGYSILLPFAFTQRMSLRNWHYLDARFVAFSAAFGLAMGWIITAQIFAIRRVTRQRGGALAGTGAFIALLASMLCCTPIVPTILGFAGLSGISLAHTSGRVQYFFATKENLILAASLGLLVIAAVWSTSRIVRAACVDGSCTVDDVEALSAHEPAAAHADEPHPKSHARAGSTHG